MRQNGTEKLAVTKSVPNLNQLHCRITSQPSMDADSKQNVQVLSSYV